VYELISFAFCLCGLHKLYLCMYSVHDDVDKQISDMNTRIDWAFNAGFDFISTESGLSEFTKPSCDLMLTLFNAFSTRSTFIAPTETFWLYVFIIVNCLFYCLFC
jgi:hypothetical protein